MEEKKEFKTGDAVRIKNSPTSPVMTVRGPYFDKEGHTLCFWFNENRDIVDRGFSNDLLEHYSLT